VEDWAEIRRLYRAEGVPIKEIVRRLGVARNTVRSALASDRPPRYERAGRGSVADAFEPRIRAVLAEFPRMPAPLVAERINWPYSITPLKKRLRQIRPEYVGIDPVDRVVYEPGQITQCDLWFPDTRIPVGPGQERILPVLVMTLAFSRFLSAIMLPSRQGGDLLSGMWRLISRTGRVTKTLVWDRESAIGGTGRVTAPAAAFAGTLATRIQLAPPRDPEFKGIVERNNGFFETSFLPGRVFVSPEDFNTQLAEWLERANSRTVRSIQGRPADLLGTDYQAMIPLPPVDPPIGITQRIRLARDYYVRVDTVDYSVDPRMIGRFVDVAASPDRVLVCCQGQVVADHRRSWAKQAVVTDPAHVVLARQMRRDLARGLHPVSGQNPGVCSIRGARAHTDGHVVELRALPDYDTLFGVDFTPVTGADPPVSPTASDEKPPGKDSSQ
jgi:transposase